MEEDTAILVFCLLTGYNDSRSHSDMRERRNSIAKAGSGLRN